MTIHSELDFPFQPLNGDLDDCDIDPRLPADARLSGDTWSVHPEDMSSGFMPTVELKSNWHTIADGTSYSDDNLAVAIRLKNANARRFETLGLFDLGAVPSQFRPEQPLHPGTDFEIVISVVTTELLVIPNRPDTWPGTQLLSRVFRFTPSGTSFPIQYADFEQRGWHGDAIWKVDLNVEAMDSPPRECLSIYVNQKLRPVYEGQRGQRRTTRDVFTQVCGGMVFSEISKLVLMNEMQPDADPSSLAGVVNRVLLGDSSASLSRLQQLLEQDPNEFDAFVLDRLETVSTIAKLSN